MNTFQRVTGLVKSSYSEIKNFMYLIALFIVGLVAVTGCRTPDPRETLGSEAFIADYLKDSVANCTLYSQILTITKYRGFLNAYGTYTCFAPTDEAVKAFILEQKGANATLADFTTREDTLLLKRIVKYMLVNDTIATSEFTDGKFPTASMYGQYYTSTSVLESSGEVKYTLNGKATLNVSNIRVANGIIHFVDAVLIPETKTISQRLEEMPEYSIFLEAMKATGWYDSLNYDPLEKENNRYMTLLAESNDTYNQYGISSFSDLKSKMNYNPYVDPNDPFAFLQDSLYMYVSFHLLGNTNRYYKYSTDTQFLVDNSPVLYYMSDISEQSSIGTFVDGVSMNVRIVNDAIRLGEREAEDGINYFGGVTINKSLSDIGACNGVIHTVNANEQGKFVFFPRKPEIKAEYWEPTVQTELSADKSVYQRAGKASSFGAYPMQQGGYANMTWVAGTRYTENMVQYYTMGSPVDADPVFSNFDCLAVYIRDSYVDKFTIKTPKLQKTRYKVWICSSLFRSYDIYANVSYKSWSDDDNDDAVDRRTDTSYKAFSHQLYNSTVYGALVKANNIGQALTSDYMESLGYKFYMVKSDTSPERGVNDKYFDVIGTYMGIMDVKTAGYYRLKITPATTPTVKGTTSTGLEGFFRIDMIHFIPEDQDQTWPKFTRKGNRINRPTAIQRAQNLSRYGATDLAPSAILSTGHTRIYEY